MVFMGIPYSTEQGIISREQGTFSTDQGIFRTYQGNSGGRSEARGTFGSG
jgi:hypothetical protein